MTTIAHYPLEEERHTFECWWDCTEPSNYRKWAQYVLQWLYGHRSWMHKIDEIGCWPWADCLQTCSDILWKLNEVPENGPRVCVLSRSYWNFTKSNNQKCWRNCRGLDDAIETGIVQELPRRVLLAIPIFPGVQRERDNVVEAKTSFGRPSINKALLNLCE